MEWDGYLPNAVAYEQTHEILERIDQTWHGTLIDPETCEYTPVGEAFRDALYGTCLDVMAACDAAGEFGGIWYKVVTLSDDEHPVIGESFRRLNRGRAAEEAAGLYEGR